MFQFEPWAGDVPTIYFNVTPDITFFVPFKHTMDIYVKTPTGTHWTYTDGYTPEDPDEFSLEMRRIRDWEWIIKLDAGYLHYTQISCAHRTIHGNQFEVTTQKNYRNQTYRNPSLDCVINVTNMEELRTGVDQLMQSARTFNLRHVPEVDVHLDRTISLYNMDRYSYSHMQALREAL